MVSKKITAFALLFLFSFIIVSANGVATIEEHSAQGSAYFTDGYTINVLSPEYSTVNQDFYVYGSFYDKGGKLQNNGTAECLFGLLSPDLSRVLIYTEDNMTFLNSDTIQAIFINGSFLNETGTYTYNYNCDDGAGTTGGYFHGSIIVTSTGELMTISQAILLCWGMFLLLVFSLFLAWLSYKIDHSVASLGFLAFSVLILVFLVGFTLSILQEQLFNHTSIVSNYETAYVVFAILAAVGMVGMILWLVVLALNLYWKNRGLQDNLWPRN